MSKTKNKNTETDDSDIAEGMPFNAIDNSSDELQAGSGEKDPVKPVKTRKGGLGLAIAVLLSLAALAASGYLYLSQNSRSQQISSAISSLENSLKTVRTDQQNSQQQLQQTVKRQAAETQSIKKSMTRLFTRVENTQQTWSVEEIHQLLQLADDQLALAGNIDGAITALSIADRRITDGGDPELQPVRKQIASDIASLQQIDRVDLAGTIHRLRAVEDAIDQLPVGNQTPVTEKPETATISNEPASIWQQLGQDMSSLVRIRRIDRSEVPLLPPEQNYYLRENIKALLITARIALLRNDTAIYQSSLQQAEQWLAEYFDSTSQKTRWVLTELKNLAAIDPAPQLPDISASLSSLQLITEGKQE
ncbi:MAG: uroporphyrinogen-III C-methyltransferase [Arenicellales bacterium]